MPSCSSAAPVLGTAAATASGGTATLHPAEAGITTCEATTSSGFNVVGLMANVEDLDLRSIPNVIPSSGHCTISGPDTSQDLDATTFAPTSWGDIIEQEERERDGHATTHDNDPADLFVVEKHGVAGSQLLMPTFKPYFSIWT